MRGLIPPVTVIHHGQSLDEGQGTYLVDGWMTEEGSEKIFGRQSLLNRDEILGK